MRAFTGREKAEQQRITAKSMAPRRDENTRGRAASSLVRLQRSLGNRAIQRMLESDTLESGVSPSSTAPPLLAPASAAPSVAGKAQAKLSVNEPGDEYEREADRVAEQVMRMPAPSRPIGGVEHDESAQRGLVMPQPDLYPARRQEDTPHVVPTPRGAQRKASGAAPSVSPQFASGLSSLRGGGRPLGDQERAFFEPRFGADFGRVRIHEGERATALARSLNARAFTLGRDIVLSGGEYRRNSTGGQRLLAHELTHVVQQSGSASGLVQRQGGESAEELEEQFESLIPESERSQGPVQQDTIRQARAYLAVTRQIISDVHRDINTLLQLVNEIEGLVSEDVFNSDLALTVLYESLDAAAIAVPESAEAITTVVAKTIKVIVMTVVRVNQAESANQRTRGRINEISGLLDALVEAQISVDELNSRVGTDPQLAALLAAQPVPDVPRRVARDISKEIEFRLLIAMVRRAGGTIATEETDEVTIPRGESPTETEMHREAMRRHEDPLDNYFLRCPRSVREFSLLQLGPTENQIHSWYYYYVDGVNDNITEAILQRLQRIGVSKERFFTVMLGPLLQYRCG